MASNITIVGEVLNTDIINRYPLEDERLLLPSVQQETFGASNDYIEFYVFDLGGGVLNTNYNYQAYKLPPDVGYSQSLLPVLEIDPIQDIRNLGYESGEVNTRYNFFRKISGEPFSNQLFIQQISTDRTEVRVNSTILTNDQLLSIVSNFTQKQATVPYYYYVILNFGNNNQSIAVNAVSDVDNSGNASILFKLANPLPNNIALKDTFWIVEEIVNPYIFDLNLDKLIIPPPQPRLKGPNFDIDLELKNVVPTPYSNYNQLISSLTGSYYQVVLNVINNQNTNINIDFSVLNDFIHYSSAENRVYNFMYKIGEIQTYQAEINTNTPLTASNPSLINSVNRASSSINEIISKFDGFEYYLYFTSSSLTSSIVEFTLETGSFLEYNVAPYPKTNSTQPYTLYASSSVTAQNWYISASEVAVAYDTTNKDILLGTIPSYITDDPSNYLPYITFVNMIGQYFDNVWIYIDKLTDLWDNDNNLNKGISQDLVYDWLQSFGIKLYNSQGDQTVLDYQVGGYSGSIDFNGDYSPSSSFLNNVPRKDLTLDSYKRLYHNLPYLFKAKGAHGGLEGLITLFGITGSILPIKEYGGMTDYQDLKGYTTDKISIGLNTITGSVLSPIKRLETSPTSSRVIKSQDLHFIDVSFSPETQIDAAVSASITSVNPTWVLDNYIGDPRDLQLNTYPSLSYERDYWFGQTFSDPFDYGGFIRLIQFFDNSLFKMVKDFTPARGNTWTGVSIKSPVLERPKVAQYQPIFTRTNELSFTPESASLVPVYDPYYYYLAGDKADYYEGNIPGSTLDTYLVFEENNRNPFLVYNTIGFIPPGFISGNTDFVLNYDSPRPENFFLNSDFNVLQNNIDISLTSEYRKKLTPVLSVDNLGRCFTSYSISESVELQDSYLSLTAYTRPRYTGVNLYGRLFNTWSVGDNSYGQSPVINYNVKKLGLFTEITQNPYLPYKSNIALKYLVDQSGSLTELNLRNRNWEEVQNTFETGDVLNVSLFDPKKYSNQIQSNGNKIIAESGYSYSPMFYAYGSESLSPSWTASAVFNSAGNSSQNLITRYFTVFPLSGSIVPVGQNGSPFLSSSYTAAGTVNMQEVWNMFSVTGSNSSFGNFYFTGSGPGVTSFNSTSSYYQIPAEGNYQFTYEFLINTTASIASPIKSFTGSMELWLSSSTGNYSLLDKNLQTCTFEGGYYNAYLANIPSNYSQYTFTLNQDLLGDITFQNGYSIRQYNGFGNLVNTIPINSGDITFRAYDVTGRIYNPYIGDDEFVYLGVVWCQLPTFPNQGNWTTLTLYELLDPNLVAGTANNSLLFRRSLNVNTTGSINPGDKVEFRFFVDTNTTGVSQIALQPNGSLKVVPTNGNLIANNIEICVDQTQNAFYLNSNLSPFYGPTLFFNPLDSQVSASYADLYQEYGDIFYPFFLQPNDKIVVQITDENGPILEYTVKSVITLGGSGLVYIIVYEDIDGYFGNLCSKYYKILFIKRIIDETSVILEYPKPSGKTSYGYIIPQNISAEVTANIDNINKNVNQQLVDVGLTSV